MKKLHSEADLKEAMQADFGKWMSMMNDNMKYFQREIDLKFAYIRYSKYPFFHVTVAIKKPRWFFSISKDKPL